MLFDPWPQKNIVMPDYQWSTHTEMKISACLIGFWQAKDFES